MLPEIDQRLVRWGEYMRSYADFGLGYPPRNVIHRCMVEGPGAGQSTKRGDEPTPHDVQEVENALRMLGDSDIHLAKILYLEQKPVPLIRRMLRLTAEEMDDIIERLHRRVSEALRDAAREVS